MALPSDAPCPHPAPTLIAVGSETARLHDETDSAAHALNRVPLDTTRYRQLATEYSDRLTELTRSETWLRGAMRAYGAHLRAQQVRPEHIVLCGRYVLEGTQLRQFTDQRTVADRAISWVIEGYYGHS